MPWADEENKDTRWLMDMGALLTFVGRQRHGRPMIRCTHFMDMNGMVELGQGVALSI